MIYLESGRSAHSGCLRMPPLVKSTGLYSGKSTLHGTFSSGITKRRISSVRGYTSHLAFLCISIVKFAVWMFFTWTFASDTRQCFSIPLVLRYADPPFFDGREAEWRLLMDDGRITVLLLTHKFFATRLPIHCYLKSKQTHCY